MISNFNGTRFKILIGIIILCIWILFQVPHPMQPSWGKLLVLIAPLIVVPIGISALIKSSLIPTPFLLQKILKWILIGSIPLSVAYSIDQGFVAGMLSLPWLFTTMAISWAGIRILCSLYHRFDLTRFSIAVGMIYLSVGGVWASLDRFGLRPLNFDPEIVFLTVAHFHYAGFVLPVIAGHCRVCKSFT